MPKDDVRTSERQGGDGREVMILEAAYAPTPDGPWETRTFTAVTSATDGSPGPSEWCPASESGFILKPEQKFWRWRVVGYTPSQPAPSADTAMARWAVECLDAWQGKIGREVWSDLFGGDEGFTVATNDEFGEEREFRSGESFAAARIAAAKALRAADESLPAPPVRGDG